MSPLSPQEITDAVESVIRKSRISMVATVVIAILLGGAFMLLAYQIRQKQADFIRLNASLRQLNADIAGKQSQLAVVQSQVDDVEKQRDQLAHEIPNLHQAWARRLQKQLNKDVPLLGSVVQSAIQSGAAAQPAAGRVVYIQYTNTQAKPAMQALQQTLAAAGFVAPGIEHVDRNRLSKRMDNVVRYFWPGDEVLARSLAQTVTDALSKSCPKLQPLYAPTKPAPYKNAAPSLPLEVWVVNGC